MKLFVLLSALVFGLAATQGALPNESLRRAAEYSARHRGLSLLVRQDGRTLLEEYSRGRDENSAFRIYSGTKAFWSLAALAAADDGILSLDEKVADTLASWRGDGRKSRITIRQLLDFSAGLAPGFSLQVNAYGDRVGDALQLPVVAPPGRAFIYGPAALQVFHEVLRQKLRGETPTHFLERRVLRRLQLGPQRYLADRAGNPLLSAGFELTARQWSRLGEVALARGQPIVRPETFAQISRGSAANRAFSLGWWNNRAARGGREFDFENMLMPKWSRQNWRDACICRSAPNDLIACIGSGYQRLYVIPSLHLVVARQGAGGSFSDAQFLRLLLSLPTTR